MPGDVQDAACVQPECVVRLANLGIFIGIALLSIFFLKWSSDF
jgi:hypothetical protein